MKIKYCLPIIKSNKQEVLKALNTKGYDFYEVWLDYVGDLDNDFLINIGKKFKNKLILVFRRQNLEKIKLPLLKRIEIINIISKLNIILDLDFLTQNEELELVKNNKGKIKLILSHHDYKQTPNLDYLKVLVSKMERYDPEIIKIATYCNLEKDCINLLNTILLLKEKNRKFIVLGMGKKGLSTRMIGSLWGNELTFAPNKEGEKSASGQLTKTQLEGIFSKI